MFLAINELLKEKARFILIIAVIVLVSYLTFFLTALAYGLATSYTQGIDKWQVQGVVLQKDSNDSIGRSLLTEQSYKQMLGDDVAMLGVSNAIIVQDQLEDISLFGIEMDSFLRPNLVEGRTPTQPDEVIISDKLKSLGLALGDSVSFKDSDRHYTIVGITDNSTFQTTPIIYLELEEWRNLAAELSGMTSMRDSTTISALIVRNAADIAFYDTNDTKWLSLSDFYFKLPGYQAQVLTFSLMIGFLIAIASFVLAIFIYILTLQKKSLFGVLKAEGVSNRYISNSVMIQIFILLFVGLFIGFALTLLTGIFVSSVVPFLVNPLYVFGIIALFVLFSSLGGLISVRMVSHIDPVEAIG